MTTDKTPTEADLVELIRMFGYTTSRQTDEIARAVLAKQGSPVVAGEQTPCAECDGTGMVSGSQAHFLCPECATPQPTQAQAVPLEYARLQAISIDYSDSEDECTGFRDGWRSAEKHHGIKGGQHG